MLWISNVAIHWGNLKVHLSGAIHLWGQLCCLNSSIFPSPLIVWNHESVISVLWLHCIFILRSEFEWSLHQIIPFLTSCFLKWWWMLSAYHILCLIGCISIFEPMSEGFGWWAGFWRDCGSFLWYCWASLILWSWIGIVFCWNPRYFNLLAKCLRFHLLHDPIWNYNSINKSQCDSMPQLGILFLWTSSRWITELRWKITQSEYKPLQWDMYLQNTCPDLVINCLML